MSTSPTSDVPDIPMPDGSPQVAPDRFDLELTESQFPPIAQILPGDAFPDWLADLYYDVEDPPVAVDPSHVPPPPPFNPNAKQFKREFPSPAQQSCPAVTSFRAIMLSPVTSFIGKPAEQQDRPDIMAINKLALAEQARAVLAAAQGYVDRATADIKAVEDAVARATDGQDPVAIPRAQKALTSAKERLAEAQSRLQEPQEQWDLLVQEYNETTPPDAPRLDPVTIAYRRVKEAAEALVLAARPKVNTWINNVFSSIRVQKLIPPKPADFNVGDVYFDTVLYIITMPEFAFNGWKDIIDGPAFNAAYPFHEELEQFIYRQIRQTLRDDYPHVRVLFAFSCCTYSSDLLFQVNLEGLAKTSGNIPRRKLASSSRITVVTSAGPKRPKRITKFYPSQIDGWPVDDSLGYRMFTPQNLLEHTGERSKARFSEITYKLKDYFGGQDESAVLAFGTCLDVALDEHQFEGEVPVNMCVYLGGGLPLDDIRDGNHSFVLNDANSVYWPKVTDKWAPGWYDFAPITGQRSVGDRWAASGSTVDPQSVARRLYWDEPRVHAGSNPVALFNKSRVSFTDVIALPGPPPFPSS